MDNPGSSRPNEADDGKTTEHTYNGRRLANKLGHYFDEQMMCDVTLKAGDYSVKAHRVVLAAFSDYFEAMFSGTWTEANGSDIVLHGLTSYGLKAVVNYCYKGDVPYAEGTNCELIAEVLMALSHCQLTEACSIYGKNLMKVLDEGEIPVDSLIYLFDLADSIGMKELVANIVELVLKKFFPKPLCFGEKGESEVKPVVNEFGRNLFASLLAKWNHYKAGYGKVAVCDLIVRWADHDQKERGKFLSEMLRKVLGDDEDMADIIRYCRLTLPERMRLDASGVKENGVTLTYTNRRTFGNFLGHSVVGYHYSSKTWKTMPLFHGAYCHTHSLAVVEKILYVVGERKQGLCYCYRFNPYLDRWEEIGPLPNRRSFCPAVGCQGKLYIVGGLKGLYGASESVDVYDPVTSSWSAGVPLPQPLQGHGIVEHNGAIYVGGGNNNLKLFLRFVPGENSWTTLKPMLRGISCHEFVGHKDSLYTIFGNEDEAYMSRYSISTGKWGKVRDHSMEDVLDNMGTQKVGACSVDDSLSIWIIEKRYDPSGDQEGWDFFRMLELDTDTYTFSVSYEINSRDIALNDLGSPLVNFQLPSVVLRNLPEYRLADGPSWESFQRERSAANKAEEDGNGNPQ